MGDLSEKDSQRKGGSPAGLEGGAGCGPAELMAEKRQEKGVVAEEQQSEDRLRGGLRRGQAKPQRAGPARAVLEKSEGLLRKIAQLLEAESLEFDEADASLGR